MTRATRLRHCPQRCGGGLEQTRDVRFTDWRGRPRFTCGKCGHSFTAGRDGEPYASVVPMKSSRSAPLDGRDEG